MATEPPAMAYVIDCLRRADLGFRASLDGPEEDRSGATWSYIHHTSVALLALALAEVAEDRADAIVEWLEGALEDSGGAEWVHVAREAVAAGKPIPLPFRVDLASGVSPNGQ